MIKYNLEEVMEFDRQVNPNDQDGVIKAKSGVVNVINDIVQSMDEEQAIKLFVNHRYLESLIALTRNSNLKFSLVLYALIIVFVDKNAQDITSKILDKMDYATLVLFKDFIKESQKAIGPIGKFPGEKYNTVNVLNDYICADWDVLVAELQKWFDCVEAVLIERAKPKRGRPRKDASYVVVNQAASVKKTKTQKKVVSMVKQEKITALDDELAHKLGLKNKSAMISKIHAYYKAHQEDKKELDEMFAFDKRGYKSALKSKFLDKFETLFKNKKSVKSNARQESEEQTKKWREINDTLAAAAQDMKNEKKTEQKVEAVLEPQEPLSDMAAVKAYDAFLAEYEILLETIKRSERKVIDAQEAMLDAEENYSNLVNALQSVRAGESSELLKQLTKADAECATSKEKYNVAVSESKEASRLEQEYSDAKKALENVCLKIAEFNKAHN